MQHKLGAEHTLTGTSAAVLPQQIVCHMHAMHGTATARVCLWCGAAGEMGVVCTVEVFRSHILLFHLAEGRLSHPVLLVPWGLCGDHNILLLKCWRFHCGDSTSFSFCFEECPHLVAVTLEPW